VVHLAQVDRAQQVGPAVGEGVEAGAEDDLLAHAAPALLGEFVLGVPVADRVRRPNARHTRRRAGVVGVQLRLVVGKPAKARAKGSARMGFAVSEGMDGPPHGGFTAVLLGSRVSIDPGLPSHPGCWWSDRR
jgi:hypothetical protein